MLWCQWTWQRSFLLVCCSINVAFRTWSFPDIYTNLRQCTRYKSMDISFKCGEQEQQHYTELYALLLLKCFGSMKCIKGFWSQSKEEALCFLLFALSRTSQYLLICIKQNVLKSQRKCLSWQEPKNLRFNVSIFNHKKSPINSSDRGSLFLMLIWVLFMPLKKLWAVLSLLLNRGFRFTTQPLRSDLWGDAGMNTILQDHQSLYRTFTDTKLSHIVTWWPFS